MLQRLDAGDMTEQECKDISFHPEPNALFHLPGYNPCRNPSCRMHACDQGIFKKLLDMVVQQIKLECSQVRTEFESRHANNYSSYQYLQQPFSQMGKTFQVPQFPDFPWRSFELENGSCLSTSLYGHRFAVYPQRTA